MNELKKVYGASLGLLTDLYELTMAQGYWSNGMAEQAAVFHLFFRRHPFGGGFTIAAGLRPAIEYLAEWRMAGDDLEYLASIEGNDGKRLFQDEFLDFLRLLRFELDVDAVEEGVVVFPQEPLVRVRGPLLQCQIAESALLNIINFQSLVATKAARVCLAAEGDPVLEFGLRRAQGIDGSLSACRAAFIGGCVATSNVLGGKLFNIPVKGTHAHSWVMSFDDELAAFKAYAAALPNNCIFLVDTYDSLEGVRRAIQVGNRLRENGHRMIGIRLDSGDLAYLSIEARRLLDEAGFPDAKIVASNDLDEYLIASLKAQGARIDIWGVGTKLVTAFQEPALGGVYKLGAIQDRNGQWKHRIKVSEQLVKVSNPGALQIRRFYDGDHAVADMLFDTLSTNDPEPFIIDPFDPTRRQRLKAKNHRDLLLPVMRRGECVYSFPSLNEIQKKVHSELSRFPPGILRRENPHTYLVGLEQGLFDLKSRMILEMRSRDG